MFCISLKTIPFCNDFSQCSRISVELVCLAMVLVIQWVHSPTRCPAEKVPPFSLPVLNSPAPFSPPVAQHLVFSPVCRTSFTCVCSLSISHSPSHSPSSFFHVCGKSVANICYCIAASVCLSVSFCPTLAVSFARSLPISQFVY